jgi:hypothetical protein
MLEPFLKSCAQDCAQTSRDNLLVFGPASWLAEALTRTYQLLPTRLPCTFLPNATHDYRSTTQTPLLF